MTAFLLRPFFTGIMSRSQKRKRGKKRKHCIIAENLPFFQTTDDLRDLFNIHGKVKAISLIHTDDGYYTRSAKIQFKSRADVKKLKKGTQSLVLDGKEIRVKTYHGLRKHKDSFVKLGFSVQIDGLFKPGLLAYGRRRENHTKAQTAYKTLEDAYHRLDYRTIRILHHPENILFYSGSAIVTFDDDTNQEEIMQIAKEVLRRTQANH